MSAIVNNRDDAIDGPALAMLFDQPSFEILHVSPGYLFDFHICYRIGKDIIFDEGPLVFCMLPADPLAVCPALCNPGT